MNRSRAFAAAAALCAGATALCSCATVGSATLGAVTATSPLARSVAVARQCNIDSVKICQDNARQRPAFFFPDAVKGESAANPSNLIAFAAPLQIPGGPLIKVACYYRPGTMSVVYARAWAVQGDQLVDLNPQPGQVLNSAGVPAAARPLRDRDYRYLRERKYCAAARS